MSTSVSSLGYSLIVIKQSKKFVAFLEWTGFMFALTTTHYYGYYLALPDETKIIYGQPVNLKDLH